MEIVIESSVNINHLLKNQVNIFSYNATLIGLFTILLLTISKDLEVSVADFNNDGSLEFTVRQSAQYYVSDF